MLMNLTRIRNSDWLKDIVPYYEQYRYKITWGDQDLLNIYFHHHPGSFKQFKKFWFLQRLVTIVNVFYIIISIINLFIFVINFLFIFSTFQKINSQSKIQLEQKKCSENFNVLVQDLKPPSVFQEWTIIINLMRSYVSFLHFFYHTSPAPVSVHSAWITAFIRHHLEEHIPLHHSTPVTNASGHKLAQVCWLFPEQFSPCTHGMLYFPFCSHGQI